MRAIEDSMTQKDVSGNNVVRLRERMGGGKLKGGVDNLVLLACTLIPGSVSSVVRFARFSASVRRWLANLITQGRRMLIKRACQENEVRETIRYVCLPLKGPRE